VIGQAEPRPVGFARRETFEVNAVGNQRAVPAVVVGLVVVGVGAHQSVAAEEAELRLAAAGRPVSVLRDEHVLESAPRGSPKCPVGKGKGASDGGVERVGAKPGKQRGGESRVFPSRLAAKGRKARYPLEALARNARHLEITIGRAW